MTQEHCDYPVDDCLFLKSKKNPDMTEPPKSRSLEIAEAIAAMRPVEETRAISQNADIHKRLALAREALKSYEDRIGPLLGETIQKLLDYIETGE
jgi:hypothetical protein